MISSYIVLFVLLSVLWYFFNNRK